MRRLSTGIALMCGLGLSSVPTVASAQSAAPSATGVPEAASAGTADGEVRKIDRENRKITLRHGEIKGLDMPAMTMVFQVRDPALLDKVKTGDRVAFKAEKANGAMVVTEIEPAR